MAATSSSMPARSACSRARNSAAGSSSRLFPNSDMLERTAHTKTEATAAAANFAHFVRSLLIRVDSRSLLLQLLPLRLVGDCKKMDWWRQMPRAERVDGSWHSAVAVADAGEQKNSQAKQDVHNRHKKTDTTATAAASAN